MARQQIPEMKYLSSTREAQCGSTEKVFSGGWTSTLRSPSTIPGVPNVGNDIDGSMMLF